MTRTPPVPCPHGVRAPDLALHAAQNDAFRRHVCLDASFPAEAVGNIAAFQVEGDLEGLHHRGTVTLDRRAIWFVIDAYDRDMRFDSPAPDDSARTSSVLSNLLPFN